MIDGIGHDKVDKTCAHTEEKDAGAIEIEGAPKN